MNRVLSVWGSRSSALWSLGLTVVAAAVLVLAPPLPEPAAFRTFVDQRAFFGIPAFWNVVSNLPLLLVGAWGVYFVARADERAFADPVEKWPYALCFAAAALAGIGSTWFHLAPDAERLMWDRLPIALGFMALLAGVIAERVGVRAGLRALPALMVAGAASVLYWRWSMLQGAENIVPYALVQYGALVAIVAFATFRSRYTRGVELLGVAAIYAAAKVAEMLDRQIYALGELLSGHTLKHLLAAGALWWLVRMLKLRRPRVISAACRSPALPCRSSARSGRGARRS